MNARMHTEAAQRYTAEVQLMAARRLLDTARGDLAQAVADRAPAVAQVYLARCISAAQTHERALDRARLVGVPLCACH